VVNIEMASTGVLPFVRGVDFTSNDFSVSASWFEMSLQNTHGENLMFVADGSR
jgi:hypothetical protein